VDNLPKVVTCGMGEIRTRDFLSRKSNALTITCDSLVSVSM